LLQELSNERVFVWQLLNTRVLNIRHQKKKPKTALDHQKFCCFISSKLCPQFLAKTTWHCAIITSDPAAETWLSSESVVHIIFTMTTLTKTLTLTQRFPRGCGSLRISVKWISIVSREIFIFSSLIGYILKFMF